MPFDSKASHEFSDVYLQNYEFGIFTGDCSIPLRSNLGDPEYITDLPAISVQLDLDYDDDGNGYPVDSNYTKIDKYPYLLRDSYTISGDEYQGGPGFKYTISGMNHYLTDGYYQERADARKLDFVDIIGYGLILRAGDASGYPVSIGAGLTLDYNFKVLNESRSERIGSSVTDEMTKIQTFYLSCKPLFTQVLADCVYHEPSDAAHGTDATGEFGQAHKQRALNLFGPTGLHTTGRPYKPFFDIVKSSTFIPTGLPYFDKYGYINIKDGDFTHLQSNKAAGSHSIADASGAGLVPMGYQIMRSATSRTNEVIDFAFQGEAAEGRKQSPNYWWDSAYPSKRAESDFIHYFYGNQDRFHYGYYDAPDLVDSDGDATGPMSVKDKSLHYRFDPSCVPYTSFRIHYDCRNADIALQYGDGTGMAAYHHPTFEDTELAMFDEETSRNFIKSFGAVMSGPSYFKYNLEGAQCGRIPPIFTLQAKLNSQANIDAYGAAHGLYNNRKLMYAVSYDATVVNTNIEGDAGQDNYSLFEQMLVGGNMYLKSHFPFPWDGVSRSGNYNTENSTAFGTFRTYSPYNITIEPIGGDGWLDDWRRWHQDQLSYGWYGMKWSYEPGSHFQGKNAYNLAYRRYKSVHRIFYGTRDMNAINCFASLKKHVDKLASSWTYDADPKESRIRMQKRLPFRKSDFSSISEGITENEVQGTTITLDDEPAPTSTTDVLPDDMGGEGGVY